ncbi:MAG: alpha-ketoglutarate-dependent dioxygenase AlkB, partial [Chloroflexota bacterium]|nr:alpha-ketoglutarate-dependent dioxygenase AlkB [Chloroflexota bacterium]
MASQIFLEPPELTLHERFLQKDEADRFFSILRTTIAWRQESMRIAGRAVTLPRLTAWYGDPGASYTYSGICNDPVPWTAALWELKERVAAAAGQAFN